MSPSLGKTIPTLPKAINFNLWTRTALRTSKQIPSVWKCSNSSLISSGLIYRLCPLSSPRKIRVLSSWHSIPGQQDCLWSVCIIFHSEFKYRCKVIKIIHDFICAKWIITLPPLIFIMQKYAELNIFCWAGKTVYSVVTLFFIEFCTRLKHVRNLITKGSI